MGGKGFSFTLALIIFSSFVFVSVWADDATNNKPSGLNLEGFAGGSGEGVKWIKNPFIREIDNVSLDELHLTAIVYSPNDSAALINGQVLRKNDRIGSNEILDITRDRVIVRNEGRIFNLVLKGK